MLILLWAILAQGQSASLTSTQAQTLVGRSLAAVLRSVQNTSHPMRYRLLKPSPRLSTVKEIVETRDGDVARLVAVNGQPLSAVDEQTEVARLNLLLSDPSRQLHRKRSEESDTAIVLKLLRMLPQAFLYEYAESAVTASGRIEKFTFRPNPNFKPSDLEMQALKAMSGELWIDANQERVTRLEGHLDQDTDYGFGILGKLDKGGWIVIEQIDVGAHQWRIARFQMKMNLRILIKNKSFDTVEEMSQYAPVASGLSYQQAIQSLLPSASQ